MKKTFEPKKQEIVRQWYVFDAKDKVLGRLATRIAIVLRGKHKTIFTPHIDTGDNVVVLNASKVQVTGRKLKDKVYRRYSGYPGGLREVTLENMLAKRPCTVIRLAVERMLPGGPLGRDIIKKLKVYEGDTCPIKIKNPISLEVK